jgi:hypothetical protein
MLACMWRRIVLPEELPSPPVVAGTRAPVLPSHLLRSGVLRGACRVRPGVCGSGALCSGCLCSPGALCSGCLCSPGTLRSGCLCSSFVLWSVLRRLRPGRLLLPYAPLPPASPLLRWRMR